MFESLLVADRGEPARGILRTAARMGLRTVAVYAEADAELSFVREADDAVLLGPVPPASSYLDTVQILEAAARTGARAVHPGSGLLAEDAAFARAVTDAGLLWIGPPPETIEATSNDGSARQAASAAGVAAVEATPEASESPGRARHVDVQVLGLEDGRVVVLGERERVVRLNGRTLVEESPAARLDEELRTWLGSSSIAVAQSLGLRSAGTVEFVLDAGGSRAKFSALRPRLQAGHALTQLVTGVDLVEEQLRAAAGKKPAADLDGLAPRGHAIGLRVYAEDDSLLGMLCAHGADRPEAVARAADAVAGCTVAGAANLALLAEVLDDPEFRAGGHDRGLAGRLRG